MESFSGRRRERGLSGDVRLLCALCHLADLLTGLGSFCWHSSASEFDVTYDRSSASSRPRAPASFGVRACCPAGFDAFHIELTTYLGAQRRICRPPRSQSSLATTYTGTATVCDREFEHRCVRERHRVDSIDSLHSLGLLPFLKALGAALQRHRPTGVTALTVYDFSMPRAHRELRSTSICLVLFIVPEPECEAAGEMHGHRPVGISLYDGYVHHVWHTAPRCERKVASTYQLTHRGLAIQLYRSTACSEMLNIAHIVHGCE